MGSSFCFERVRTESRKLSVISALSQLTLTTDSVRFRVEGTMKKRDAAILGTVIFYLALWVLFFWSPTLMKPVMAGAGSCVGFITVMVLREKFGVGNAWLLAIPAIAFHYAMLFIGSRLVG